MLRSAAVARSRPGPGMGVAPGICLPSGGLPRRDLAVLQLEPVDLRVGVVAGVGELRGQAGDLERAALESLISIKRAGADMIITYFAKDAVRWLDS